VSSKHLLDPEIREAVESFPGFALDPQSYLQVRADYRKMVEAYAPPDRLDKSGVRVAEKVIPGSAGHPDLRVIVITPLDVAERAPAVLEIHGGGFVIGSADFGIAKCIDLARKLQSVVVSVDYRLAPETKFPGPQEDCYAALKWLHNEAAELGVDRSRIAVLGESAGGGLAASVALLARDRKEVAIRHLHLIFPMLDDRTCAAGNDCIFFGEFVWTRPDNDFAWSAMLDLPPGSADVSPYAAPARMEDLSALPPTFISCGALDLLLEENLEFGRKLIRAGVPVELHIYPGAPHGYAMGVAGHLLEVTNRDSVAALHRALACDPGM